MHDYIWFFLVCAPKGVFDECRAVTVIELDYSYPEANAHTCIKAPKWISVFVGSSLKTRSQVGHQLLHMERKLVKAFLYFLRVMGWEKIYSHMVIQFLFLQWKVSKVYLRDKSLESINLVLQVQLVFPKASFCIMSTKEYLCTFAVLHVRQVPKPMLKVFCFICRDKNQVYLFLADTVVFIAYSFGIF